MPKTGPRWIVLTLNPTRNWCYKELITPLHHYLKTGVITDELLCRRNVDNHRPMLDDAGKPDLLIELFEGSTYENKENLGEDFIQALESSYRGQMRDRFLLGLWGSYEGLIYPEFDEASHMIRRDAAESYLDMLVKNNYEINWLEGYDYGLAEQSCYLNSFVDPYGNIIILDGFYRKEYALGEQIKEVGTIRDKYGTPHSRHIDADPAIFRRGAGGTHLVGRSVADMLWNHGDGLMVRRGNNNIINGITKVQEYIAPIKMHKHPITLEYGAPHIYFVDDLEFIAEEFNAYSWNTHSKSGEREDKPKLGQKDHSMDVIKYMLSRRPKISKLNPNPIPKLPSNRQWQELEDDVEQVSAHRYG